MKTNVSESSLISRDKQTYRSLDYSQTAIIEAVKEMGGGWVSRRQIAEHLADKYNERVINTGAVSGRVNELIAKNGLEANPDLMPCPVTGNPVHYVRLPHKRAGVAA